jgi:hypothetical protein
MPEMTNKNRDENPDLLNLLLAENIISAQQCELVKADCVATGIAPEDILLARRWIKIENLHTIAPWLKTRPRRSAQSSLDPKEYQASLEKYRQLLHKILDEPAD